MNDNPTNDDTQDIQNADRPEHDAVPFESPRRFSIAPPHRRNYPVHTGKRRRTP